MNEEDAYTITGGPLKPHEYIQIKREITAKDEAWIQNHSAIIGGSKKNPQMQMTIGDVRLAMLKRMIISWQLTKTVKNPVDGTEAQVPIVLSEQAIEDLPRRVSAYVHKFIDLLNPDDEESDEDFTPAANGHSESSSNLMKMHL